MPRRRATLAGPAAMTLAQLLDKVDALPRRGVRMPPVVLDPPQIWMPDRIDRATLDATLARAVAVLERRHRDLPYHVTRVLMCATAAWLQFYHAPAACTAVYARAVCAPMLAMLEDAAALIATLRALPAPPPNVAEEHLCEVGNLTLLRAAMDDACRANARGAEALGALKVAYPFAINAWSESLEAFRDAQSALRVPLQQLGFDAF